MISSKIRTREWSLREWVNAQDRQQTFLNCFAPMDYKTAKKFPGYGGAAGGGKSYIGRKGLAQFLLQANAQWDVRNCRVGLFCEDFPTLRDRQISKIREEFPSFLGEIKDHRDLGLGFFFKEKFGSNFIALRNLDDPSKYDSTEFAGIFVDEFTKNKQPDLFDQLRKRLRWPQKVEQGGVFPPDFKFPLGWGSNPGGPLHGLAKQYWVDHDIPKWLKKYESEFVFIPAKATDNIYNPAGYYDDLLSLPDELRKAYAEGSWDIFAGQFFKEWRESYHVCDPFDIPKYWKRLIAYDHGWSSPTCILFFAISPDGELFCYHELYGTERLPEWWADRILEQVDRDGISLHEYQRVIDPATQQKDPRFGKPVREMLQDAGVAFEYANNDRLSGWVQVRRFLAWERDEEDLSLNRDKLIQKPKLLFFRGACPNAVRTLPTQVCDKNRIEDMDTDGEDHASDTVRYALTTRPVPSRVPFKVLSQEFQEAILRARHRERHGERGEG